jgi:hypothetical protein
MARGNKEHLMRRLPRTLLSELPDASQKMFAPKPPEAVRAASLCALADPQNQSRFTVTLSDRQFVLDMYRPIFAKTRRKRKKRKTGIVVPISLPLEPAA